MYDLQTALYETQYTLDLLRFVSFSKHTLRYISVSISARSRVGVYNLH